MLPYYGVNPSANEELNIYRILEMPLPEPEFDLADLSSDKEETNVNFEPETWCRAEDERRADALREFPWHEWPKCSEYDLHYLGENLGIFARADVSDASRASAISMRGLRLKFLGAVLKFTQTHWDDNAAWVTLSHPDWRFGKHDMFWDEFYFDAPRVFRCILRMTGVMTAPGFLISYLHTQFDPKTEEFYLQYRGLCSGEKQVMYQQMTASLNDASNASEIRDYIGSFPRVSNFVTTARKMENLKRQLPNLMPNTVTMKRGSVDAAPKLQRVPEPHHSAYLIWAELYRFQPVFILSGVRIQDGQLVIVAES
jgi:hypothetical protein